MDAEKFSLRVSSLVTEKFDSLPKNGKPKEGEWTVLAGIVESSCDCGTDFCRCRLKVVAIGSGSKCVGTANWCSKGSVIHDSHAEVLAKRSFQMYLSQQVDSALQGLQSVFEISEEPFTNQPEGIQHSGISEESFTNQSEGIEHSLISEEFVTNQPEGNEQSGLSKEQFTTKPEGIKHSDISEEPITNQPEGIKHSGSKKLKLKDGVRYHLYISHTPCGDCSIFPNDDGGTTLEPQDFGNENLLSAASDDTGKYSEMPPSKKLKVLHHADSSNGIDSNSSDIHRTGAKCVLGETADPLLPGNAYHRVGVLRTKPGRGDKCLSHCCSDKILRWTVLGMQGSLLMPFLSSPVYLSSLVLGNCPADLKAVERGIFSRYEERLSQIQLEEEFSHHEIAVFQSQKAFSQSRGEVEEKFDSASPSPASVCWVEGRKAFVSVEGRKFGVTKKVLGTEKSQDPLCRYQTMKRTVRLRSKLTNEEVESLTYLELKNLAVSYRKSWERLKREVLTNWTEKPKGLQDFTLKT